MKRYCDCMHAHGILVQLHNDSVSGDICEDMVEIGIDMWQGVLPQDDICGISERVEGKLCLLGGMDMQKIDNDDYDEAAIRAEVRRTFDEYVPLGCFIPCVTSISAIHRDTVGRIIDDEMRTYGARYAQEHF